jgi:putative aldouronate transport system permease protein
LDRSIATATCYIFKESMVITMTGVKRVKAEKVKDVKVKITWKEIRKQKELILLSIPFVVYVLLFCYVPLIGWVMAFQKYKPKLGFFKSEFVGLDKFKFLFVDNPDFIRVIRNTLAMGVINLVLSFVTAILFALILNEVVRKGPKKLVQTISYLPHFLSMIIVCGILKDALSIDNGIVNEVLVKLHILKDPINFFTYKSLFWWIVGFANVWKETGWNSIIYLAAITAINPDLYEAASIDGAGRLQKMWNITLPGIKPTIFILLLINIGGVLNAGFEIQYLLTNGLVQSVSQTIDIYVLKFGISQADYSLGTAAGIFKSVVSIILIFLANSAAKAAGEERLF